MENWTPVSVTPSQSELLRVVGGLNGLFVGYIPGWNYIAGFDADIRESFESDTLTAFIYPNGWPRELFSFSCRLYQRVYGFAAYQGEVRAHHLVMPDGSGPFRFAFEVVSVESYFRLSGKGSDLESARLFAQARRHSGYR
jgi:hypothetical protein